MMDWLRKQLDALTEADQAFLVVVVASYLTMFTTSFREFTLAGGLILTGLGFVYMVIGVEGFRRSERSLSASVLYFFVQIPLGGVIVYLGKGVGFNALLLLPLAGQAMMRLPQVQAYLACAGILFVYGMATSLSGGGLKAVFTDFLTFTAGLVFIMVFTQLVLSVEKSRKQGEILAQELAQANQQLRAYAVQVEELAITRERNRLAREIHDGLGHHLTTIHMQLQATRALIEIPGTEQRARELLAKAQAQVREALADVRVAVSALRTNEETRSLEVLLRGLIEECSAGGVQISMEVAGTRIDIPAQVKLTFYRAAQECLNNVRKHARAQHVRLLLDFSKDHRVKLVVLDDGTGSSALQWGYGLMGLTERAQLMGGELRIMTAPGEGFTVEMELPV